MSIPMVPDDDLDGFYDEAPSAPKYKIENGRYQYPAPPGVVRPPRGWRRMTNHAAAFSDQIRLQHWRERMLLLGMRADEGLLFDELAAEGLEAMSPDDAKDWLEKHADKAVERAGGGVGARRGTARHTMLQVYMETGVLTGHRTMRLQMDSLLEALASHYLEPIPMWSERRVCNPRWGVMGTLDLAVSCMLTGQRGILDLKTQRKFWSYQEIAGQQTGYDCAPWVWEGPHDDRGHWERTPTWDLVGVAGGVAPGRRVALLAHMPQQPGPEQLPVEIHEVALDYGNEVMDCAAENIRLRSIGSSVAEGRRVGGVRPRPVIQASVGVASRAITR
jgi:hypothetical protein